jgi:hypothetical protein
MSVATTVVVEQAFTSTGLDIAGSCQYPPLDWEHMSLSSAPSSTGALAEKVPLSEPPAVENGKALLALKRTNNKTIVNRTFFMDISYS